MCRGVVLVLIAAVIWGTAGTANTYAPDAASARSIDAARVIIGGIGLLLYAWFARKSASRRCGRTCSCCSARLASPGVS